MRVIPLVLAGLAAACSGGALTTAPDALDSGTNAETAPTDVSDAPDVPDVPDAVDAPDVVDATPTNTTEVVDSDDASTDAEPETLADTAAVEAWEPEADPFDRTRVTLHLALGTSARAALNAAPATPVAATMFVGDAPESVAIEVSLPAIGDAFRPLSADATLFVRVTTAPSFPLPTTFWLDASLADPSYLRSPLAALFHAREGVPAGRTVYARVSIDGTDQGLFIAREDTSDPTFIARHFGPSGSVFAPTDYAEFWSWQIPKFALVVGDEADRTRLTDLATQLDNFQTAINQGNATPFAAAVDGLLDLDAFTAFMAAGVVVGHTTGYGARQSDFAVHVHEALAFYPRTLAATYPIDDSPDPTWSSSRILRLCITEADCRARWASALDAALTRIESAAFEAEASALRGVVLQELASDPSPAANASVVNAAQEAVLDAVRARAGWLRANSACLIPESVDHDGDGFSACTDDCDDDQPDVHPGAPEICGNLRDDDCNYRIDDGPECPVCPRVPAFDARWDWELCSTPRTWEAALADCRSRGGDLASIETYAENEALVRATLQFDWTDYWFGLSDRETEGAFVWSDGRPINYRDWNAGEPNDAGGNEDCGHLASWAGGHWNDAPCDWWKSYVCEQLREP